MIELQDRGEYMGHDWIAGYGRKGDMIVWQDKGEKETWLYGMKGEYIIYDCKAGYGRIGDITVWQDSGI